MRAGIASSIVCLALMTAACGSPSAQKAASATATGATQPAEAGSAGATDDRQAAAPDGRSTAAEARLAKSVRQETELPAGAILAVRIDRALSTARNRVGDTFVAVLDAPVLVDGVEVLPRGTRFTGHVTTSDASGRLKGRAVLGLTLDALDVNGRRDPIRTSTESKVSEAHQKRNVEIIGGGAGLGALIGGLAGGGKGAGVGAAVGAGAGTGAAAATGKKEVEIPAEALLRFSLKRPVKI